MKTCFVQFGNDMSIQYKVLYNFLSKNISDSFIFDRYTRIGFRDDQIIDITEIPGRQGITVPFEYIRSMLEHYPDEPEWFKDFNPHEYDMFFVNFTARNVIEFTLFCYHVKVKYNKPIIVGGGVTSYLKEYLDWMLSHEIITHYIIGPAEEPLLKLFQNETMPGVIVEDTLPVIDYPGYILEELDIADVFTMRGCPHSCNFCPDAYGPFKLVDYETLADWIERIYTDHNITKFRLSSCYSYKKQYFIKFYRQIEHLIGKISFDFMYWNPHDIDTEIVKLIKTMNVTRIGLGVETFSNRLLRMMKKRNTPEDNIRALECLQKNDIPFWAERMYALPTETWKEFITSYNHFETFKSTYKAFNYDLLSRNYFRLCPHTPMWNEPETYSIKIEYYPGTKILKCWHDMMDADRSLFKVKLGILKNGSNIPF